MTAINPNLAAAIAAKGVPLSADLAPLSAGRETEIREHVATTKNFSIGNLAARDLLAELDAVRKERDEALARVAELENPKPRKQPTTKDEFGSQGGRVVCLDCKWTSAWFDTNSQYGAFRSASLFHHCEDEEAAR